MDGQRRDRWWRLVAARSATRSAAAGWIEVVCAVVAEQLEVDAAAVTVRTSTLSQDLVAASGEWAESLEELQYTVGEGPGVAAFEAGEPVLAGDLLATASRWPGFAEEAAAGGAGAVFAFPLPAESVRLGTLTLYRRRPGALTTADLADASVLAELATTALVADHQRRSWPGEPGFYDEVNIASGMLAAQLRISLPEALLRLRAHAFSRNLPLTEVAQAVLHRRLRFDPPAD